jgi:hypothetical protein
MAKDKNGNTTTTQAQLEHKARWDERQKQKQLGEMERTARAIHRTPQEQLARLDQRNGVGVGARKERARLAQKMQG